jgi:hypothetical protein
MVHSVVHDYRGAHKMLVKQKTTNKLARLLHELNGRPATSADAHHRIKDRSYYPAETLMTSTNYEHPS